MRERVEQSQLSMFPEDFFLARVGTFNPQTGELAHEAIRFEIIAEVKDIVGGAV